ncbi:MAG: Sfum_1244 family protein [Thermodesulfobacteriota bacterium]
MQEMDDIAQQVLRNCAVSDSRHAGYYSVCGLALRLRDLYKWEKGLEPWVEEDAPVMLDWIGAKEEAWERLAEDEFEEILIDGTRYDPFDVEGLNAVLGPRGLCYGSGYVHGLKPTFFLARIEEKKERLGHAVYLLGKELARDLITAPALTQGDSIFVRKESARLFLWNQMFFIKKSGQGALRFALEHCGLDEKDAESIRRNLARISDDEVETYVYHELGEVLDPVFDRDLWRRMLAAFPQTPVELLARTVKDILADTTEHGKLRFIIRHRRSSSLGFYVAFLDGLRKELFPEIVEAFDHFRASQRWATVEEAVEAGYERARAHGEAITAIFLAGQERNDMEWARQEMERQVLAPLGLGRGHHPKAQEE